jgi:hypothetical protein
VGSECGRRKLLYSTSYYRKHLRKEEPVTKNLSYDSQVKVRLGQSLNAEL